MPNVPQLYCTQYNFRTYPAGSEVDIELSGVRIGNEQVTPDVFIQGDLVDPDRAFISVRKSNIEKELGGRTIGLAMEAYLRPDRSKPDVYTVIMQKLIAPGAFALYYAPEDIDPNYQGCAPKDKIERMMAYYAHVAVDGKLLF